MRTHIGQYRIETPLGRGGMGVVYRGVHEHLGRPVAIKALAPELTQQPEFKERFFSEAKTQARLQHPNIVGVYDLLEDGGEFFIVMEFVAGEGLDDVLRARNGQGMDIAEATAIFSQVLAALDYAHSEGVIHRDIKPSNVMITQGGRVKLTDFGIALLIGDKRLTASQSAIGTPTYISPEQILRPRSVDHRTDIYSAAVVFFEMIAGRPPFDEETEFAIKKQHVEAPPPDLSTLNPLIPASVVAAVSTALAKDPDARFPSAGTFQRVLHEAVPLAIPAGATPLPASTPAFRPTTLDSTGAGKAARQAPPPPPARAVPSGPPSQWRSGPRLWIAIAAAVVVVLGLGFGVVFLLLNRNRSAGETAVATKTENTPPQAAVPAAPPAAAQPVTGEPSTAPVSAPAPGLSAAPFPSSAAPAPRPERPRSEKALIPRKEATPEPPPPPPVEMPKPVQTPAPAEQGAPERGSGGSDSAPLGQLQQMEDVVLSVERFAKQALDAYEDSGREGSMGELLEAFAESSVGVRKEFRKASGTGLGGFKAKLLKLGRTQQADTKILEVKAKELIRQGEELDRAIQSDPLPPGAQKLWAEVKSQLRRLHGFFP